MKRNPKQLIKRYIIEFFVIVLGVSVSFMAEQGRQRINEYYDAKDLIEKAMSETKFFLLVDSFKVHFNAHAMIERMIAGKPYRPDSMHLVLINGGYVDMDINEYTPSLFALTKRTDLSDAELELIKQAAGDIRIYRDQDAKVKSLIEQLESHYFNYGISDDLAALKKEQLKRSKKARDVDFWNPLSYGVSYSGQYDQFVRDPAVIILLKQLGNILINEELVIIDLKKARRQAVAAGYK